MFTFTVTVATGSQWFAGTDDYIYLTLVGSEGCSDKTLLDKPLYNDFERGAVDSYELIVSDDIGEILLVKIEKRKYWVHDDWYCKYITIKTPTGEYVEFPCYRWITDHKEIELRDGHARLPSDDQTQITRQHRRRELEERQKLYSDVSIVSSQLKQDPGPDNPIFLPTDSKNDWLLAKIWVRSTDFQIHQTVTHLLNTHLMSEVFGIALYRQLPAVHPLFKLLVPHVRFTIAINTKAREQLICECGLFDKANATGGGGHVRLVQRAMLTLNYKMFCFPESIQMRGVGCKEELPYYYFRDDGVAVWEAVQSFVTEVVNIYYDNDEAVQTDTELQAFVKDVFVYGLRDNKKTGFPKTIKTIEKLIEYVTVVIFTTSAQHAAVNFGQYDWCSWIPNSPPTMRQPPPTEKGVVNVELIIESLPDRGRSCWHLGAVWALSQFQDNELFLGMYPDEHFIEKPVKDAIANFRSHLDVISQRITERNKDKKLPYYYMSPDRIPNSVAV
ncbi:polyunsaturated fatty acid 5-lipoxygenase-like [Scyliorhinus canicula]|uniref:polyunsaturated fatty acid 5-lipoxygenase-like n=1 Tax=Scyliorhinus canicula TaxID=7830 RepID=UPI0018F53590|nr:polyunsaturated fatty acid 5-lipoxygenase-like [Scyliorhinus canicula]